MEGLVLACMCTSNYYYLHTHTGLTRRCSYNCKVKLGVYVTIKCPWFGSQGSIHPESIHAAAEWSVLAQRKEQVTCGCAAEERCSCQTEMTATLPPLHGVSHMRANKGRTKDVRRRRRRNGMSNVKPYDNISTSGIYDHFKQHNLTGSYCDGY